MLRDLDLGSVTVTSTHTVPARPMTVASCTTEIWPFEVHQISTFGKVELS